MSENTRILSFAFRFLSRRDFSKRELEEKLKEKYGKREVEEVIRYLEKKGLIDDKRLAKKIMDKYMEKGKGYYYITGELKRRKIDEKVIDEVMDNFDFEREFRNGERYFLQNRGKKDISSIFLALKSRGYSEKTIERIGEKYGKQ